MEIACLDLEGVLVPEIWIAFAEKTGIESLRATTRDIPDYDVLMKQRLRILDEHGLKLSDIQEVIATLKPLDGAIEFVDWLRERFQVVILSDTFYEFSQPLMRQLGFPTLLCHRLITDDTGRVTDYQLRQKIPSVSRSWPSRASTTGLSRRGIPTTTPPCWARPMPGFCSMRRTT